MIISSQHTTQDEIVAKYIAKIEAGETMTVVVATLESDEMAEYGITGILVDGHHRLEAANRMGVAVEMVESDYNYQAELDNLGMDGFLAAHWNDGDWYDIATGNLVF